MNKQQYEVCQYVTRVVIVEADNWEAAREQARGIFNSSKREWKESVDPHIDVFEVDRYQQSYPHKYVEQTQGE